MESATWCRTPLPPPPSEGCTADHKHPDYNPVAASERSEQRTERNHCGKRDERANGTATASMSAISISGGTDATNIAAPSFGAMPPELARDRGDHPATGQRRAASSCCSDSCRQVAEVRLRIRLHRLPDKRRMRGNLARAIVRQPPGRDDGQQRDACHKQQADLEGTEPRLGVDAHRLLDLIGCGGCPPHDLE